MDHGLPHSQASLFYGPSRFKLVTSRTSFALTLTSPLVGQFEASEEEARPWWCFVFTCMLLTLHDIGKMVHY